MPPGVPWELDPASIAESLEIFPRTVLAGDMGTSHIVLAMLIADAQPKTLRIWRKSDQRIIEERTVTPDADGFARNGSKVCARASGTSTATSWALPELQRTQFDRQL